MYKIKIRIDRYIEDPQIYQIYIRHLSLLATTTNPNVSDNALIFIKP